MTYFHRPPKPLIPYTDETQLQAVLDKASLQPHDHLLIRVAHEFKLDASQVPLIRTEHVKIESNELLLPTGPRRGLEPHLVPSDLMPELATYLQTHDAEFLFTGRDGQMIATEAKYRVKKYAVQAGYAKFREPIGNQVYTKDRPPCHFTGKPHRPRPENTDPRTGRALRDRPAAGLAQEEITRMLQTAKAQTGKFAERNYVMLAVMYRYALRPGEPGRLLVHHINLRTRRIYIVRLKKGRSRQYLLFEDLVNPLNRYLAARPLPEGMSATETPVLFPGMKRTKEGKVYGITAKAVNNVVKQIAKLAGVKKPQVRAYSIRHSMGTHLLDAEWGLEDVQHHLGQTTLLSTPDYAKVTTQREAMMTRRLLNSPHVAKF